MASYYHFARVKFRKHKFLVFVSLLLVGIFYVTFRNNQHLALRNRLKAEFPHDPALDTEQQFYDVNNENELPPSKLESLVSSLDLLDRISNDKKPHHPKDDSTIGSKGSDSDKAGTDLKLGDEAKDMDNNNAEDESQRESSSYKLHYSDIENNSLLPELDADSGDSRDDEGYRKHSHPPVKSLPRPFQFEPSKDQMFSLPPVDYSSKNYKQVQSNVFEINGGIADHDKLSKIKKVFLQNWKNYRKYAIDHDEILPITNEPRDPFVGWSITLIDTLDTLYLMRLDNEFLFAISKVAKINFKQSPREYIPIFETVIRALGGLISAYDLSGEKVLLDKAIECGDMLVGIFDTPNNMPLLYYRWSDEDTKKPKFASRKGSVAEFGTLLLEYTRLAQITGNDTYFHYVHKITNEVETFIANERKNKPKFELNGLLPTHLDISGCEIYKDPELAQEEAQENEFVKAWVNAQTVLCKLGPIKKPILNSYTYTLGGLADSFYEYLVKQYHLLNGAMEQYLSLFEYSSAKIKKYMLFKAKLPSILHSESQTVPHLKSDPDDVVFLSELQLSGQPHNEITEKTWITHLSCFAGGMFALDAKVGSEKDAEENLRIGKQLTNGCYKIYELMELMPEWIIVERCPEGTTEDDPDCQFDVKERIKQIRMKTEGKKESDLNTDDKLVKDIRFYNDNKQSKNIESSSEVENDEEHVDKEVLSRYLNVNKKNFEQVLKGPLHHKVSNNNDNDDETSNNEKVKKFPKKPKPTFKKKYRVSESDIPSEQLFRNSRGNIYWPVDGSYSVPLWANNLDGKFILRPELIESVFYMYRITGDLEWREKGWKLFESTVKHAMLGDAEDSEYGSDGNGVSAIADVTHLYTSTGKRNLDNKKNSLESFWFAETLKYYYLLFEDKDVWSLDEYVLNTEAHPFKRANRKQL